MNFRRRTIIKVLALAAIAPQAHAVDYNPNTLAISQAVRLSTSFSNKDEAFLWFQKMSKRLRFQIKDPYYRLELLRLIHRESTKQGLKPELVMAVIQVESSFNREAISNVGARGLMQLMPFWIKEIGYPGDNLFNPSINLKYGCTVLRSYLKRSNGKLDLALSRYHGSTATNHYAIKVKTAMRSFIV